MLVALVAVDDLDLARLGTLVQRDGQVQHAVVVARVDPLGVDVVGNAAPSEDVAVMVNEIDREEMVSDDDV